MMSRGKRKNLCQGRPRCDPGQGPACAAFACRVQLQVRPEMGCIPGRGVIQLFQKQERGGFYDRGRDPGNRSNTGQRRPGGGSAGAGRYGEGHPCAAQRGGGYKETLTCSQMGERKSGMELTGRWSRRLFLFPGDGRTARGSSPTLWSSALAAGGIPGPIRGEAATMLSRNLNRDRGGPPAWTSGQTVGV